jgi:hypothetical protein
VKALSAVRKTRKTRPSAALPFLRFLMPPLHPKGCREDLPRIPSPPIRTLLFTRLQRPVHLAGTVWPRTRNRSFRPSAETLTLRLCSPGLPTSSGRSACACSMILDDRLRRILDLASLPHTALREELHDCHPRSVSVRACETFSPEPYKSASGAVYSWRWCKTAAPCDL